MASTLPYQSFERECLRGFRRDRHHSLEPQPRGNLVVQARRRRTRPFADPTQTGANLIAPLGNRERENSRFNRVLHPLIAQFVDLGTDQRDPGS